MTTHTPRGTLKPLSRPCKNRRGPVRILSGTGNTASHFSAVRIAKTQRTLHTLEHGRSLARHLKLLEDIAKTVSEKKNVNSGHAYTTSSGRHPIQYRSSSQLQVIPIRPTTIAFH